MSSVICCTENFEPERKRGYHIYRYNWRQLFTPSNILCPSQAKMLLYKPTQSRQVLGSVGIVKEYVKEFVKFSQGFSLVSFESSVVRINVGVVSV